MKLKLFLAMSGLAAFAQDSQTFDVASVKPSSPGERPTSTLARGGRMTYTGFALKSLVQIAYDIPGFWVSGGPAWIQTDRFDIVAKADDSASQDTDPSYKARMLRRLQALLADRFRLQLHRETKDLSGYVLVVAKGGSKLQESKDGDAGSDELKRADGSPYEGIQMSNGIRDSSGRFLGGATARAQRATMAMFADILTRNEAVPVVDKTGLSGKYNFTLAWAPNPTQVTGDAAASLAESPSLVTAIQRLGLRLESAKIPVETIVIDHAEKPSPN
jgi:uncharacterized protein (TIGR03435 family)